MKKAVIQSGGRQYIVSEGDELVVNLLSEQKSISFPALLVIDDKKVQIGAPEIKAVSVEATVLEQDIQADKVTAIRYKAKKRVHKVRGHRQRQTKLKITKIS